MRKITKIKRSIKAISPVISVLLMIAIAVAASLVAFAWVSGYMDFTTTKVGKSIQIQSVSTDAVYVQNVGNSPVTIADVYVDGVLKFTGLTIALDPSQTATINTGLLPTPQATVKIVTTDGISAEYTETFSGATSTGGSSTVYYTVSFTLGTGGASMTPSGSGSYSGSVAISATPDASHVFDQWTSTGSITFADANSASTTATVSGAGTISALFDEISASTHTITASAGANGAISPSGAVAVNDGNDRTFTITADNDYQIADVLVDGTSVGAQASYTFQNVVADHTISATFEETGPATYTITASAGANGVIDPSGAVAVTEGSDRTFTITPDSNYQIADVEVDGTSIGAQTSHTFTNVAADHTIEATFEVIPTSTASMNPLSVDYLDGDDQVGSQISQGIDAMEVSDDSDYVSVDLNNNLIDYVAEFDFTGIGSGVSTSDVTQITINLEGCYDLTTTQTTSIYNFNTDSWDQIDQRSVGDSDILLTFDITSGASNYVDTDGSIDIKINAPCDGQPPEQYHRHRVDFFEITVTYMD